MTMMALPRPIEPKSARKMSELEKIDQVCIGCFVTEFSIAPSSRKAKGGLTGRGGTVNRLGG